MRILLPTDEKGRHCDRKAKNSNKHQSAIRPVQWNCRRWCRCRSAHNDSIINDDRIKDAVTLQFVLLPPLSSRRSAPAGPAFIFTFWQPCTGTVRHRDCQEPRAGPHPRAGSWPRTSRDCRRNRKPDSETRSQDTSPASAGPTRIRRLGVTAETEPTPAARVHVAIMPVMDRAQAHWQRRLGGTRNLGSKKMGSR